MEKKESIHIVNTNSHVMWDVMVDAFGMTELEQSEELKIMHYQLKEYLSKITKGRVEYDSFRNVLNPYASFFMYVFDSSKIHDAWYGKDIKSSLIQMFDKKTNGLFMFGDYLVEPKNNKILKQLFERNSINVSNWSNMTQYYLVCVVGISVYKSKTIHEMFKVEESYCGFRDLTVDKTWLKTYLGMTIPQACIKIKNMLFFSVPDDEEHLELNYSGFESEDVRKLGIELISIPESLYLMFLHSRPQSFFMDEKEFNNSIRILHPTTRYQSNFIVEVTDEKLDYIKKHIKIIIMKDVLENAIKTAVERFQISHIRSIEHNVILFNVPFDYNEKIYIIALKWNFDINKISIITVVPLHY